MRKLPVIQPLTDAQQRSIRYLRISLTDRCNYRCTYCMPEEGVELVPKEELLDFEEIERVARVFARLGVTRIRLTGGEPTIRRRVVSLVERLSTVPGISSVVMTTNGHRLPELAEPLAAAGLEGVNVSLDTVDPERFRQMTRRGDLARVMAGIEAAVAAGLVVKLNAVALRAENRDEIAALCQWAWERGVLPRFIEHMPMSAGMVFVESNLLSAAEIRDELAAACEDRVVSDSAELDDPSAGPARYFRLEDQGHRFGIISAMTEHFCATCNRVRISSTGDLHTCLAYDDATDLRSILRSGEAHELADRRLEVAIRSALHGKRDGHDFQVSGFGGPRKHMVSIGG